MEQASQVLRHRREYTLIVADALDLFNNLSSSLFVQKVQMPAELEANHAETRSRSESGFSICNHEKLVWLQVLAFCFTCGRCPKRTPLLLGIHGFLGGFLPSAHHLLGLLAIPRSSHQRWVSLLHHLEPTLR